MAAPAQTQNTSIRTQLQAKIAERDAYADRLRILREGTDQEVRGLGINPEFRNKFSTQTQQRIQASTRRIRQLEKQLPSEREKRKAQAKEESLRRLMEREAAGEQTDVQVLRDRQRAARTDAGKTPDTRIVAQNGRVIAAGSANQFNREQARQIVQGVRGAQERASARAAIRRGEVVVSADFGAREQELRPQITAVRREQRISAGVTRARDFAQREDFASGASIPASTISGEGVSGLATYGRQYTGTVTSAGGTTIFDAPYLRELTRGARGGFSDYAQGLRQLRAGGFARTGRGFAEQVGITTGVAGRIGYEYTLGRFIGAGANVAGRVVTYGARIPTTIPIIGGRTILRARGITGAIRTQQAAAGFGIVGLGAAGVAAARTDETGRQRMLERAFISVPAGIAGFGASNFGIVRTSVSAQSAGMPVVARFPSGRLRTFNVQRQAQTYTVFGTPETATAISRTNLRGVPLNQDAYLVRGTTTNIVDFGRLGSISQPQTVQGIVDFNTGSSILRTPQTALAAAPRLQVGSRTVLEGVQVDRRVGGVREFATISTANPPSTSRRGFVIPQKGIIIEAAPQGGGSATSRTVQQQITGAQARNRLQTLGFRVQEGTQRLYSDPTGGILTALEQPRGRIKLPRSGIRTTPNIGFPIRNQITAPTVLFNLALEEDNRVIQRNNLLFDTSIGLNQEIATQSILASPITARSRNVFDALQLNQQLFEPRQTQTSILTSQTISQQELFTPQTISPTTPFFDTPAVPPSTPFIPFGIGIPTFAPPSSSRGTTGGLRARGFSYTPDLISAITGRTGRQTESFLLGIAPRPIARKTKRRRKKK